MIRFIFCLMLGAVFGTVAMIVISCLILEHDIHKDMDEHKDDNTSW